LSHGSSIPHNTGIILYDERKTEGGQELPRQDTFLHVFLYGVFLSLFGEGSVKIPEPGVQAKNPLRRITPVLRLIRPQFSLWLVWGFGLPFLLGLE
jgi:hypothetical protein